MRGDLVNRCPGRLVKDHRLEILGEVGGRGKRKVEVAQGEGVLRAWGDVQHANLVGATVDVALTHVNAQVDKQLQPLALRQVVGRLGVRRVDGGMEYSTQGLQFETEDGFHWPGGNVRVAMFAATERAPARGEMEADRLDLAAMTQIANRLALGERVHAILTSMDPKGLVERVRCEEDRRVVYVSITTKGLDLLEEVDLALRPALAEKLSLIHI